MKKITLQEWGRRKNFSSKEARELFDQWKVPNAYPDRHSYVIVYMDETTEEEHEANMALSEKVQNIADRIYKLESDRKIYNDRYTKMIDDLTHEFEELWWIKALSNQ